ncbi:MAG: glycosyltransferase [Halobacteriota archaeon]
MTGNNDELTDLPTVSVIVPAYNAENNIGNLIESLLELDYPPELLELIMVDNNSTDRTKEIIEKYPVKLLEENDIQSSYAARNKGIKHARGEIIAFTDSDCIATKQWVREGVRVLISENADLVGGRVEFIYSQKKTCAELYDSMTNMQIESNIKERNVAKTANLFSKSNVFNEMGMFPDGVKSGGDVQWTAKATKSGYSLVYAPKAVIKHPARPLIPLLSKQYRVGKGMAHIRIKEKKTVRRLILSTYRLFYPPKLSSIEKLIYERGKQDMIKKKVGIWFVSYLCDISTALGILVATPGLKYDVK